MRSERDAEQLEIDTLRRLAKGPPSAESWAEITAGILRFVAREGDSKSTLLGIDDVGVNFIDVTRGCLQELAALEPGDERLERTRELIERVERMAVEEYDRVDRINARAECLAERWDGAFEALDASLAHWPDALRVLPYEYTSDLHMAPEHGCWRVFRHVELGSYVNMYSIRTSHPHLVFTLKTTTLASFDAHSIPMVCALDLDGKAAEGLGRLTRHRNWSGLRALRLYGADLSVERIREMGDAGMLSGLETLSLRHCELEPEGAAELVEHLDPSRLAHIDLTHSLPGVDGLRHVLSLTAARPTYLDLTGCDLDAPSVARLSRSRVVQDVLHLGLSENDVEDAGALALARSSKFVGLRRLELRRTRINDDAASALAESVHMLDLRELDVRDNRLTQTGLVALATSELLDRLERLDVTGNHLDQRTWLRLTGDEVTHAPLRAHLKSQRK